MDKCKEIILIFLIFGFALPSYSNAYQIEQTSQEEETSCPLLFLAVKEQIVQSVKNLLIDIGEDPNISLEGCRGDELYDSLPKDSTLLHVAAHLDSTYISHSIYRWLEDYGANKEAKDENGDTPQNIKDRIRSETSK